MVQGNIVPKTPEAALVAAQAYLLTTRPNPGDPREHIHRAALNGLNMMGHKLSAKGEEAHHHKETHKPRSPRRHSSPWRRSSNQRSRLPSPKQHGGTRRSRSPNEKRDYEENEKEMGASCFTRRVRTTPVPKGFKLPHDQQITTDHRNHNHGSQIIYKQYKYWEEPKKQQCKVCNYTSPAQQGHG
jgi:hypothetical protein